MTDPSFREIDQRVAAIQDVVTYDELPSPQEAIVMLNTASAWAMGLREMLHPLVRREAERPIEGLGGDG